MGLDMYLKTNSKKVCHAASMASGSGDLLAPNGVAIYWRKANAIHRWFVENVQYGEDDCGTYEVSVEQLIELRDTCKKVMADSKLAAGQVFAGKAFDENGSLKTIYEPGEVIDDSTTAEELLPTIDGFFFGGTEYDSYYLGEVSRTIDGIDAILENVEKYRERRYGWESWREKGELDDWNVTFHYHASW